MKTIQEAALSVSVDMLTALALSAGGAIFGALSPEQSLSLCKRLAVPLAQAIKEQVLAELKEHREEINDELSNAAGSYGDGLVEAQEMIDRRIKRYKT